MTLGEKQELFASLLPGLILKCIEIGVKDKFKPRVGDLFRDPRVHGSYGIKAGYGSANSMHKLKLAVDIYFIRDSSLLGSVGDYQEVGEWWEKQHELCRWGGRFKDGNHFSLTHDGKA